MIDFRKRKMKIQRLCSMLLAGIVLVGTISFPTYAQSDEQVLSGKTAVEITQMMGKGWNLGNTLDADGGNKKDVYSQERSWGNPQVTKELIDGVKAAGFTTIRIPVTWYRHIDKGNNYQIDEEFMARVKEIVDYAYDNDLFVILNVHHETWVNSKTLDTTYEKIGEELAAVWSQIADNFADYDQHLIFEGMNEPRAKDMGYEWTGNAECYKAINYLDQIFVETIRNNGKGYNAERALMIPGYAAGSGTGILKAIEIPQIGGSQAENIIISVHCYSPYAFCLSDEKASFDPSNSGDTGEITTLMTNLNSLFLSKGIPVVIGECGATNTKDNTEARKAWCTYISDITEKYQIPAVLWDNGSKGNSGGERHKYFDRKTGEMVEPEIISCFIYGDIEAKTPKDMMIDFEPYQDGGGTVIASPDQYGFTPKNIGKVAKINHTADSPVGFSAVISTKQEKSYAAMDLTKYAGMNLLIKGYISSKSSDTVSVGIIDGDETIEKVTVEIGEDWTEVSFTCQFSEEKLSRSLYFQGAGADDFYLDDISITMIDDAQLAQLENGQSGAANTTANSVTGVAGTTGLPVSVILCIIVGAAAILTILIVFIIAIKNNSKNASENASDKENEENSKEEEKK